MRITETQATNASKMGFVDRLRVNGVRLGGSGTRIDPVEVSPEIQSNDNTTYWLPDNAETVIRLRGWLNDGRGEELLRQTTCVTPPLAL